MKPENILISSKFEIKISDFGDTCSLMKHRAEPGIRESYVEEEEIEVQEYAPFSEDIKPVAYILVDLLSAEKKSIFSYREQDKQESCIHRVMLNGSKS